MIDLARVRQKAADIRGALATLRSLAARSESDFVPGPVQPPLCQTASQGTRELCRLLSPSGRRWYHFGADGAATDAYGPVP